MERRELQENYQDLCDLVQAVENADSDQARKIAQNHVRRFNQYMQAREQEEEN
jgi:DNA-binding FadR family transcriptional regulator